MKHLIICREFPPACGGGIGTYAYNISRLMAENGECVHIISQLCENDNQPYTELIKGRLIVHRIAFDDWTAFFEPKPHPELMSKIERELFHSSFHLQCFAWSAALLAEKLITEEEIDVIEAQEYEAPLYYFQLRRAIGLGPIRQPPTIVHLHSPTWTIAKSNEWLPDDLSVIAATRLEEFSIKAADGLICPSRYLTNAVHRHYGLQQESINVIPYPVIGLSKLDRVPSVWNKGSICYIGRLEPRKGVIEWIRAAVCAAEIHSELTFDFVGENVLRNGRKSGQSVINGLIPKHLRSRFRFHGHQPRSSLPKFLIRARIAVVPSRWENFPNTCIEAMSSGLPVIATATGGMAEMVENGRTGWIASTANALTDAIFRALSCSAAQLEEMGEAASSSIREQCDPQRVFEAQLAVRKTCIKAGAVRSRKIPENLNWLHSATLDKTISLREVSSICKFTQLMIAPNDVKNVNLRIGNNPLRVLAAIDNPIRTVNIVLRKLRGKLLRRLRRGRTFQ